MNLKVGIVGLPNVGKSTLFNILTKSKIPAENYPFTTIDPNVGVVQVRDDRIKAISEIVNPAKEVPAIVEFVDIAGLVKGAHKGEGLGNKFLANIREVSIILHVVRNFEDSNITHVSNKVDPLSDIQTIHLELILKDLETVKASISKQERDARGDKKIAAWVEVLKELEKHLEEERLAIDFEWGEEFEDERNGLSLLTDKKVVFLVNTNRDLAPELAEYLKDKLYFEIDLKQELELMEMSEEEKGEYIAELGLKSLALNELVMKCYRELGLISFFTAGEKEVKAWTIFEGSTAPQAAGTIHTDFEKNFIAADVVNVNDFIEFGGWEGAKTKGKVRLEGRDYIVEDGDIMIFRHG